MVCHWAEELLGLSLNRMIATGFGLPFAIAGTFDPVEMCLDVDALIVWQTKKNK